MPPHHTFLQPLSTLQTCLDFKSTMLMCCMSGNQYGEIDGQTAAVGTTRSLLNVALSNVPLNRVSNAVTRPPLHHLLHQMIVCQTEADGEAAKLRIALGPSYWLGDLRQITQPFQCLLSPDKDNTNLSYTAKWI